jgi:uncharacterized protein YabE (DUF348 family)
VSRKAPWVRIPPSPPCDTACAVSVVVRVRVDTPFTARYPQNAVRAGPARRSAPNPVRSERKQRYGAHSGCRREPARIGFRGLKRRLSCPHSMPNPRRWPLQESKKRVSGILPRDMPSQALEERLSSPWVARVAVLAGLLGLAIVYVATGRPFSIRVGEQTQRHTTHALSVGAALKDAGMTLRPGDVVFPSLTAHLRPGMAIEVRRASSVEVDVGGEIQVLRTASRVPENILAQAGVRFFPGDRVLADGLPVDEPGLALPKVPSRLEWVPGVNVTVDTGSGRLRFRTSAGTVGGALAEAGFSLYQADTVSPNPSTPISGPMTVVYRASHPVYIDVDGKTIQARASADTVGGALGQAGLSLVGLDYARPSADEPLPADGHIRVVRVTEQVRVELTPVDFETQYQPLNDVEIDQQRVIQTGAYGVQAHQVRIRYEDGEETGRIEEGSWLAKQPDPRVIGYGTNIVVRTVSTDDGTIEYWRAVRMWATSYSASRAGVSPDARNFGITASGQPLTKGLVAIDRRYIPFGTRMYVPGYGYALAADTGSGVKGRWIDLGYDDDNYVSWHQYVTVYFLTPIPPESSIVWIFPP